MPWFLVGTSVILFTGDIPATAEREVYNVRDLGARGDGKTDDTATFQRALDEAGKAGGGAVLVRSCESRNDRPQVDVGEGVRRAVITDNVVTGEVRITNLLPQRCK
jgi:hypothetical protein